MSSIQEKIRSWLAPECLLPPLGALCLFGSLAAPRGTSAMLAIFALLTLFSFAIAGKLRAFALPRLLQVFLICFGYFLLSVAWSPSPRALEMGRDALIVMTSSTILFASLNAWPALLVERVARAFAISFGISLAYLLLQGIFDFPINRWVDHLGPDYVMQLSNVPKRMGAALLLFAWPIAAYLTSARHRLWLSILLLAEMALTLPLLFSRTALVGAAVGLLIGGLAKWQPRWGRTIGLLLLPLGILSALLAIALLSVIHGYLLSHLPLSGQERLNIWQYTIQTGAAVWPFGIGLDGSRAFGPQIQTHPHNIYLQIFLEGGLIGTLLASLLGAVAWAELCKLPKTFQPYCWGFIASQAMLLASAYGLWQGWWLAAHALAAFMLVLVSHLPSHNTLDHPLSVIIDSHSEQPGV